jgi:hypothetical protein
VSHNVKKKEGVLGRRRGLQASRSEMRNRTQSDLAASTPESYEGHRLENERLERVIWDKTSELCLRPM